jgi:hypothetical protein
MGIPFNEIGQRISAAELTLYQVYYRSNPWGEERADIRNALLMAQTANMHRDPKTNPTPFEVSDFMPFSKKVEEESELKDTPGMRERFKSLMK